jgi:glyoxylase-like metal-dependent hydrolase (beta-lactamase superfamily II)
MVGKMSLTQSDNLTIHTYTAPDDGWNVNSHIIELATQLIIIDAQYMLPYAQEVVSYAQRLMKPITRLYISHYHPDHLLGAVAFDAAIYALQEVKAKIEVSGDRVAAEEHEKHPDRIPTRAERPTQIVEPSSEVIDGVRLSFILLQHAETENSLMIGIPDKKILITQDLVYRGVHAFIAERAFDTWLAGLHYYKQLPFEHVLPGHGAPGGTELYEQMSHYLVTARGLLSKSTNGDDLKSRLIAAFPDFTGIAMLDHQRRFLFPPIAVRDGGSLRIPPPTGNRK